MVKLLKFTTNLLGVDQGRLVGKKVAHIHAIVRQKGKDEAVQNHRRLEKSRLPLDIGHDPLAEALKGAQGRMIEVGLRGKGILGQELQKEILIKSRKNPNKIHPAHGQNHQNVKNINIVDHAHIRVRVITMT